MMRCLFVSASLTAGLAGAAFGQTVDTGTARLEIRGVAPGACAIGTPTPSAGVNARVSNASRSSAEIQFTSLVNPDTAEPRAASIEIGIPVVCTAAHTLVVRTGTGELRRQGMRLVPASAGFRESVAYGLTVGWAGQSAQGTAVPLAIVSPDAAAGAVSLGIAVVGGGQPLVAGDYTDTVTVEINLAN